MLYGVAFNFGFSLFSSFLRGNKKRSTFSANSPLTIHWSKRGCYPLICLCYSATLGNKHCVRVCRLSPSLPPTLPPASLPLSINAPHTEGRRMLLRHATAHYYVALLLLSAWSPLCLRSPAPFFHARLVF